MLTLPAQSKRFCGAPRAPANRLSPFPSSLWIKYPVTMSWNDGISRAPLSSLLGFIYGPSRGSMTECQTIDTLIKKHLSSLVALPVMSSALGNLLSIGITSISQEGGHYLEPAELTGGLIGRGEIFFNVRFEHKKSILIEIVAPWMSRSCSLRGKAQRVERNALA